ncbi:M-phase inducer phosphatase 1-B isoform X1 [Rhipicephalus microplus]|uniref:M-phase inducer phosphatase 1-B isoform X1 n=1 Tax=Rhipicephalus microplus TaxID=6941 RepID=UPI003F6AF692
MKEEEPSPTIQCWVLKDVSNRTNLGRRQCNWRRRLLGHHDSDEGIHSSSSHASSCGSQENAPSCSSDSGKKSSDESASWDGLQELEGASALDFISTGDSDDGFVSSLEDCFLNFPGPSKMNERVPDLPESFQKLLDSPLTLGRSPTFCTTDKENVPNIDSDSADDVTKLSCSSAEEETAANHGASGLLEPTVAVPFEYLQGSVFKRPVSPGDIIRLPSQKRSKGILLQRFTSYTEPSCSLKVTNFTRSRSDTDASIMNALQKSTDDPDLIGDYTKPYALPLVKGKHDDLKMIRPSTLADVLRGKYDSVVDDYMVIDCRYPFEFDGGHIQNAINLYSSEHIVSELLDKSASNTDSRRILVFHCEFSSERGPKLSRLLREKDRQMNEAQYPALKYPEIYVLEGGYKAFYNEFQDLCTPQGYIPMRHKNYEADLRLYRGMAKTEGAACKCRGAGQARPLKKF